MRLDHEWFAWTWTHLGRSGAHSLHKKKVIHCVFIGLDAGSKWRLLYPSLHPTTKHLNRLIRNILVFLCTEVDTMADWWQLTQGGSKLRCLVNQLSWEGPVQNYVILTGISEQPDLRKGILKWGFKKKKNTGWIFIIIGWMWTHIYVKTSGKVNFASDGPFNVAHF